MSIESIEEKERMLNAYKEMLKTLKDNIGSSHPDIYSTLYSHGGIRLEFFRSRITEIREMTKILRLTDDEQRCFCEEIELSSSWADHIIHDSVL